MFIMGKKKDEIIKWSNNRINSNSPSLIWHLSYENDDMWVYTKV